VIEMQKSSDDWTKTYDALVQGKIERLRAMSEENRAALRQQWDDLFKDVEGALNLDPASPAAQMMGDRWLKLLEPFTAPGSDPAVARTHGAAYSTTRAWPAGAGQFGDRRAWDFIRRVLAVR
jgi:hypothetical protein